MLGREGWGKVATWEGENNPQAGGSLESRMKGVWRWDTREKKL